MQTFINNLGKIRAEVQHISGKSGQNNAADYQSRNPSTCDAQLCQLCTYVSCNVDTIIDPKLGAVQQSDVLHNRWEWKKIQSQDRACNAAKTCLKTGQIPSKKEGKVFADTRKLTSNANLTEDGLLVVYRTIPFSSQKEERIVIPSNFVRSVVTQLHNRENHPSRHQLKMCFEKEFFGIGLGKVIDDLVNL